MDRFETSRINSFQAVPRQSIFDPDDRYFDRLERRRSYEKMRDDAYRRAYEKQNSFSRNHSEKEDE